MRPLSKSYSSVAPQDKRHWNRSSSRWNLPIYPRPKQTNKNKLERHRKSSIESTLMSTGPIKRADLWSPLHRDNWATGLSPATSANHAIATAARSLEQNILKISRCMSIDITRVSTRTTPGLPTINHMRTIILRATITILTPRCYLHTTALATSPQTSNRTCTYKNSILRNQQSHLRLTNIQVR